MGTTARLITFAEMLKLPDVPGKRELLAGEPIELPPAKRRHNRIAEGIYLALVQAAQAHGRRHAADLGQPHIGMGYRIGRGPDSWLVPDASVSHPRQPGEDYYEGAPLLAVEVISESNTEQQIGRKRELYFVNSAREVWEVDADTERVLVCGPESAEEFTGELRSEIIPGLRIDLRELFAAA
jgi:Uma2 family endonuclease